MRKRIFSAVTLIALFSVIPVQAAIYQYVDDAGKKIFVDRLSKVPKEYRDQIQTREERKPKAEAEKSEIAEHDDVIDTQEEIDEQRQLIKEALLKWTTPYTFQANRILIPVKVSIGRRSVNLSMVMDTGASGTVVHKQAIRGLYPRYTKGNAARIADGSIVNTDRVAFDEVEIGPYNAKKVSAAAIEYKGGRPGNQGLLGMDFLLHADYKIDKLNRVIIWNPARYAELKEKLLELDKLEQQLTKQESQAAPGAKETETESVPVTDQSQSQVSDQK